MDHPADEAITTNWRLVQDGFERAASLPTGEARDAFLNALAADAPQAAEQVRALLGAETQASAFLGGVADEARRFETYALQPGQQVGRYRIVECLAAGGMGVVYRAHDPGLQRDVALKFLHPSCADDPVQRRRFFEEARAASRLDHEHICTIHEIGETDARQVYIAMALCPGADLGRILRERALRLEEILRYAIQLADALAAAHAAGIVHRDLKPANMIVDEHGKLRLVDFGIAVMLDGDAIGTARPVGTVAYMAPEQVEAAAVDHRCDVWAIGVTLYEALTGHHPFRGPDTASVIRAILQDDPAPPGAVVPGVPPALDAIVVRCLRRAPDERYALAADVREALREVRRAVANDPAGDLAPAQSNAQRGLRYGPQPPAAPDSARYVTVLMAQPVDAITENAWREAVTRFGGRVAEGAADFRVAVFGYPFADEFAAQRAMRCGLSLTAEDLALAVAAGPAWVVADDRAEPVLGGDVFADAERLARTAGGDGLLLARGSYDLVRGYVRAEPVGLSGEAPNADAPGVFRVTDAAPARGRLETFARGELTPFVGRTHELGLLQEAWARCLESDHPPVLVAGEAGIGKSRLVYEFKAWAARGSDAWIAECLCSPHEGASPLQPVSAFLRGAILGSREAGAAGALQRLTAFLVDHELIEPELRLALIRLLGVPEPEWSRRVSLTPEALKEKTLEALVRLLLVRAARAPCLVIVEDLHWADPTTLEFLERLRQAAAARRLLIVGTHRPEFKSLWGNVAEISRIGLTRLRKAQASELLDAVPGARALDARARGYALEKSDGNPLFIEELAAALIESDDSASRVEAAGAVPWTLRDALAARLDRLGDAKILAQTAAVLGRQFDPRLLEATQAWPREKVEGGLHALIGAGLVLRQGYAPDAGYYFKHALIRDAAYESLDAAERRARHRRAAAALVTGFPEWTERQPELAAYHYQEAGDLAPAADYWSRAASQALGRFAITEAAEHARAGLAALRALPQSPERLQLELRLETTLGPALMAAKGYADPEVSAVYSRARALCGVLGNPPAVFPVLFGLWTFHCVRALHRDALQLAEQLVALAAAADNAELRAEAHMVRGITRYFQGAFRAAAGDLAVAWDNYDADEYLAHILRYGQDPGMVIRSYQSWNAWMLGEVEAADGYSREAMALARRTEHPFSIAYGLTFAAWHALNRGQAAQAQEMLAEAIALCREQKLQVFLALALALDALRRIAVGELNDGYAAMEQSLAVFTATGAELFLPAWYGAMAQAVYARGDALNANALLGEAIDRIQRTDERWCLPELWRAQALLAASAGDPPRAGALLTQAAQLAAGQGAAAWQARIAETQKQLAAAS
jgi:predicted ATPase